MRRVTEPSRYERKHRPRDRREGNGRPDRGDRPWIYKVGGQPVLPERAGKHDRKRGTEEEVGNSYAPREG